MCWKQMPGGVRIHLWPGRREDNFEWPHGARTRRSVSGQFRVCETSALLTAGCCLARHDVSARGHTAQPEQIRRCIDVKTCGGVMGLSLREARVARISGTKKNCFLMMDLRLQRCEVHVNKKTSRIETFSYGLRGGAGRISKGVATGRVPQGDGRQNFSWGCCVFGGNLRYSEHTSPKIFASSYLDLPLSTPNSIRPFPFYRPNATLPDARRYS